MAAALVTPCSGPYLGTWDAQSLGVMNDDGFVLRCTIQGQEMNATDQYGATLVEGVYRGQNWRARMTGMEWETGLLAAFQMFGQIDQEPELAPTLSSINFACIVGDLWSNYWQPLVLTAILGDPPTTPASLTAANAAIAPEMNTEFMMTSKLRELPLEFVLIPYEHTFGSHHLIIPFSTL